MKWVHDRSSIGSSTSFSLEILESIPSSVLLLHFLDLFRTHFSTYSSFCTPSCPQRRNLSFFMCRGCLRSYSMLLSWACKTLWDMLCYIVLCKGFDSSRLLMHHLKRSCSFSSFRTLCLASSINHRHETIHRRESKLQPCLCMMSEGSSSQNAQFQFLLSTNLMKRPTTLLTPQRICGKLPKVSP